MDSGVAFAGVATRNEGVKVTGKLGYTGHPMIEHFKFLSAHTRQTAKITIPAPSAIYGRPVRPPMAPSAGSATSAPGLPSSPYIRTA